LIGSLRLLCRLSSSSRQRYGLPVADAVISDDSISAWRDPAIVAALVSFLPRTIRFGQHQVTMTFFLSSFIIYFLWGWSRSIFSRLVYRPPRPRFFFFSIPLAQSLLFISFQTLFRLRAAEAQKIPVCSSVQLLSILSTALLYDNNESVNRFDFQAGCFCCCCCCPVFIFLTLELDVI
jgi:hypothetical protein